jgi:hypothetical protein
VMSMLAAHSNCSILSRNSNCSILSGHSNCSILSDHGDTVILNKRSTHAAANLSFRVLHVLSSRLRTNS